MKRTLLYALGLVALGGLETARAQDMPAAKVDMVISADAKTESAPVVSAAPAASTVVASPVGSPVILQTNGSCSGPGCSGPGCISQACGDCNSGCNSCCNDCCESRGGIYAAIGFYYIRPHWEQNVAFFADSNTITNVGGVVTQTRNSVAPQFDYGYDFAPRVILGYVNDSGFGGRISWWRFDQSANAALVQGPSTATTFTSVSLPGQFFNSNVLGAGQTFAYGISNDVSFDVWDLEASQQFLDNDCWQLTGAAGIRYVHLNQNYNGTVVQTGLPAGAAYNYAVHSSNTFNGAGPTVFLEGTRRLGNGGLSLYGNGRVGVLFGDAYQNQYILENGGFLADVNQVADLNSRHDLVPFFEGEVGVQFQGQGGGNMTPFGRLGLVGQSWWGTGSATSVGADSNFGFLGLNVLAGVTY